MWDGCHFRLENHFSNLTGYNSGTVQVSVLWFGALDTPKFLVFGANFQTGYCTSLVRRDDYMCIGQLSFPN